MSYYKTGCSITVRGSAFEKQDYQVGVGALIATPSYIAELISTLDAEIKAHDREIGQQSLAGYQGLEGGPGEHLARWRTDVWLPFMTAWVNFVNDHDHWYNNLWGATVDSVNTFRTKLHDLRASAEEAGYSFGTPAPRPPDEGLAGVATGVGRFVKNVAYALLALGGGYMLYKFYLASRGGAGGP